MIDVTMTVTQDMWDGKTKEGNAVTEGYASMFYLLSVRPMRVWLATAVKRCATIGEGDS